MSSSTHIFLFGDKNMNKVLSIVVYKRQEPSPVAACTVRGSTAERYSSRRTAGLLDVWASDYFEMLARRE